MNCLYLGQCGLILHLQLYLINISYIRVLLQACRVPSAFTFAGVGQEQQHGSWGRTLMEKWITNVCLYNLKPWLFMPAGTCFAGHMGTAVFLHRTHKRAWQCEGSVTRGECCVGMPTDWCIHPQQEKYSTSTCHSPKTSSLNCRPKGDHLDSHVRTQLP